MPDLIALQMVLHLRTQLVRALNKAALEDPDINADGSLQQMDGEKQEMRIADELCKLPLRESDRGRVTPCTLLSFALSHHAAWAGRVEVERQ